MSVQVNTALVIKTLKNAIESKVSGIKFILDPSLTYDSGIKRLRATKSLKKVVVDNGEIPLFIFNRSPLQYNPDMGRRSVIKMLDRDTEAGTADVYKVVYARTEIRFVLIHPNFREIEKLEIEYLMKEGIKSINSFELVIPAVSPNPWKYTMQWQDLEELQIETEGVFFTGLTGSAILEGNFIYLKDVGSDIIKQITAEIDSFYTDVLSENPLLTTITIVPE